MMATRRKQINSREPASELRHEKFRCKRQQVKPTKIHRKVKPAGKARLNSAGNHQLIKLAENSEWVRSGGKHQPVRTTETKPREKSNGRQQRGQSASGHQEDKFTSNRKSVKSAGTSNQPEVIRRSSRLRNEANVGAKQRLSRLITRNLQIELKPKNTTPKGSGKKSERRSNGWTSVKSEIDGSISVKSENSEKSSVNCAASPKSVIVDEILENTEINGITRMDLEPPSVEIRDSHKEKFTLTSEDLDELHLSSRPQETHQDAGLDTQKQSVFELFTQSIENFRTLPLIDRYWPNRSETIRLEMASEASENRKRHYLPVIDCQVNTYAVGCRLSSEEWDVMNELATRFNWVSQEQLGPDTKYFIVKDESFFEKNAITEIQEEVLKANASRAYVLRFNYVVSCVEADALLPLAEEHVPDQAGARKKIHSYPWAPLFHGFAFWISHEISVFHAKDRTLIGQLLEISKSKLCSTLEELENSSETTRVILRSTYNQRAEGIELVHYHWLYSCFQEYAILPFDIFNCDITL